MSLPARVTALQFALLASSCAAQPLEWPPLRKGTWEIRIASWTPEKGAKTLAVKRQLENNPGEWFQRHPAGAPLGRAGCRFSTRLLGKMTYEIKSECDLQKGGLSFGRGTVKLDGENAFVADWEVKENGKVVCREHITGARK